jgi:nucleotidyltransferase/DNA polymerase involved in DNA repair
MLNHLYACIYINHFLVTMARCLNPALVGAPVIVGGDPKQHGRVTEASPEALVLGICPGMATWEALRRCPQAILAGDPTGVAWSLSRQIVHLLEEYGPQVEQSSINCLFLQLTGGNPPLAEGRAIQERLQRDLDLTVAVGMATNHVVASMAARSKGSDGLVLVPPGEEASFLSPLPISYLPGLEEPLRERLAGLGVKRIGDLQTMSLSLLAAQFGKEGKRLHDLARGAEGSGRMHTVAAAEIFDRRLGDQAVLRRWAIFLCGRVGQQLRERRQTARSITVALGHPERPPTMLTNHLAHPSDVDQTLSQAVQQELAGQRLPGEGVISMEIMATALASGNLQLCLFPDRPARREDKFRRINDTVNRIERKYGESAIFVAAILDQEILSHLRGNWHGYPR